MASCSSAELPNPSCPDAAPASRCLDVGHGRALTCEFTRRRIQPEMNYGGTNMTDIGTLQESRAAGRAAGGRGPVWLIRSLAGALALLVALLGLVGTAIRDPRPHDIPVGLVGPAPAVRQVSTAFGSAAPGAFQFTTYGSEDVARAALDSRSVEGVLVLGASVTVETVHPFASGDPHGLILFFLVVAVLVSALVAQALLLGSGAGFGARL